MVGRQEALGSIGQSLADTVDSAMIGRHESVVVGEAGGDCQTGRSGSGCQSSGEEFTPGN
jgi:hypothetical protein